MNAGMRQYPQTEIGHSEDINIRTDYKYSS